MNDEIIQALIKIANNPASMDADDETDEYVKGYNHGCADGEILLARQLLTCLGISRVVA